MQNGNMTAQMRALQRAGIAPEAMARHLATQGFGSEQAFLRFFQTGDRSGFTDADFRNGKEFFDRNPDITRELGQMMSGV